eukprot:jgi/Psemu1/250452/estExt_Genewise1Plus.C_170124
MTKSKSTIYASAVVLLILGLLHAGNLVESFTLPRKTTQSQFQSQFQLTSQSTSTSTIVQPSVANSRPLHLGSRSSLSSSSSALGVATGLEEQTEEETSGDDEGEGGGLPELGADGVWKITNEAEYRAVLENNKDKLIVLKVFAPWCKACKGLAPKFQRLVNDETLPIVWADLNIQGNKDFVKSIGVLALPTVQLYAGNGLKVDTFPCGPSKVPTLKRKLIKLINDNIDAKTRTLKTTGTEYDSSAATDAVNATAVSNEAANGTRERPFLRKVNYLSDMLESEYEELLTKATLLTFEAGSIVMREGNVGRTFYIILEGEVEICQRTSFEDPLTVPPSYLGTVINQFTHKGDYFGERALITGEPRAASIRASSRTMCLAFDKGSFPKSSILSGFSTAISPADKQQEIDDINDKYGVAFDDMSYIRDEKHALGVGTETMVSLLVRLKLIRSITRCFDYTVKYKLKFGDPGSRRRRNILVSKLQPMQRTYIEDAFKLIDEDGSEEINLMELRRVMDSVGESKSDAELLDVIDMSPKTSFAPWQVSKNSNEYKIITKEDFFGLMAESETYQLFIDTFETLDPNDSGFVRARDLDAILCGVRDLISDDRKSIIDVEDDDMMVDYEQFSRMLLGTALNS